MIIDTHQQSVQQKSWRQSMGLLGLDKHTGSSTRLCRHIPRLVGADVHETFNTSIVPAGFEQGDSTLDVCPNELQGIPV